MEPEAHHIAYWSPKNKHPMVLPFASRLGNPLTSDGLTAPDSSSASRKPVDEPQSGGPASPELVIETGLGKAYWADSLDLMTEKIADSSVDLIMTSPPFGLVKKKSYGNVDSDQYVQWFKPFAKQFMRILKDSGSLVIDIGGSWNRGLPTKSLYQYDLLICLCREFGFNLAQEFYWWNPSKLPTPAEWVTIRRIRVKDAINNVFWLSKTPWPKASNRRVLQPYSDSMKNLLVNGYRAKLRPSGHDISEKFSSDNKASIPPNLLAAANTESTSNYLRYCEEHELAPNPARFPSQIPEFFIQMLTDEEDLVLDPFGGSCVTGAAAEKLKRNWVCGDIEKEYLKGARGRFIETDPTPSSKSGKKQTFYKIAPPGLLSEELAQEILPPDGGKTRPQRKSAVGEGD